MKRHWIKKKTVSCFAMALIEAGVVLVLSIRQVAWKLARTSDLLKKHQ